MPSLKQLNSSSLLWQPKQAAEWLIPKRLKDQSGKEDRVFQMKKKQRTAWGDGIRVNTPHSSFYGVKRKKDMQYEKWFIIPCKNTKVYVVVVKNQLWITLWHLMQWIVLYGWANNIRNIYLVSSLKAYMKGPCARVGLSSSSLFLRCFDLFPHSRSSGKQQFHFTSKLCNLYMWAKRSLVYKSGSQNNSLKATALNGKWTVACTTQGAITLWGKKNLEMDWDIWSQFKVMLLLFWVEVYVHLGELEIFLSPSSPKSIFRKNSLVCLPF